MKKNNNFYEELLEKVISDFYSIKYDPDEKGLIEWNTPSEKEKRDYR